MSQRKCTKTKAEVARATKRITLPISDEEYQEVVKNRQAFREWLDGNIKAHPELFPKSISEGYTLHDMRSSEKMPEVNLRRIRLKEPDEQGNPQVFTIAPSGIMPYMSAYTDEIEKALFLRTFHVPYWALAYVFGKDDKYWYRLELQFGRCNVVQTVVKKPENLPEHLLADEKITWLNGEEVVIATTVGDDCILGASVALGADTDSLTEAYGRFKQEAQQVDPEYTPQTVNTDGWAATQRAWLILFPRIVIIECFLHAFIKIRDRGRHLKETFNSLSQRVWDVYRAADASSFRSKAEELRQWAEQNTTGYVQEAVFKLCAKVDRFVLAYDHPNAHRTSNMLDRHMNPMARWLDGARFFHGHWTSAEQAARSWALLHDFAPYCPRAKVSRQFSSPAHKLNGFVYHQNWLHNLLISTSMSGISR
jgi:hypothetical protein